MKLRLLVVLLCVVATGAGLVGVVAADPGSDRNFRAHLSGDEEVPPVDTRAQGQAVFQLNRAGDELSYRLNVANIENVTMAHIHCGEAGVNGPVAVWLYPPDGPPGELIEGRFDGVLATGTITPGTSTGCAGSFENLLALMRDGGAYVNVHTSQNTGGEIRGQIH